MVVLADFDDTGLDVDCLALITAAAQPNVYIDSNRGGTQTPDDGELGLGTGESLITRIRILESGARVFVNGSDVPVALSFEDYFGADNATSDRTLWIQTDSLASQSVQLANTGALGANYLFTGASETDIGGIGASDTFLIAVTTPAAAPAVALEADGDAAVSTGAASLTVVIPVSLEADGDAAASTGGASLTVTNPPAVALEASGSATVSTGSATLTVVTPVALEAEGNAAVSTGTASLMVAAPVALEADGDAAVSTGVATLSVTLPGAIELQASGSASVTTGSGTLTVRNVKHYQGEHGRFGMTLAYCTLAAAQPLAADGRAGRMSVRMRQILAASHRISELRGSPLYAVRTETFDAFGYSAGTTNWWALPVDIARLISVTANGQSVALPDAALRWRQIGIPSRYGPPLAIEAEWGPGWRGAEIDGSAIAKTDQSLTTPSPEPDWWEDGAVLLVEEEIMLLGEQDTTSRKVTRTNPVAHVAGDWIPIFSPDALQTACAAMARRLNWQEANPSRKAEWTRLEQDYAGLIRDGV